MKSRPHREICSRPDLRALLTRYEFGALTEIERADLEGHILECDACFGDLDRGRIPMQELMLRRGEYAAVLRERQRGRSTVAIALAWTVFKARRLLLRPGFAVSIGALILLATLFADPHRWNAIRYGRLASFPREAVSDEVLRAPGRADPAEQLVAAGGAHYDLGRYREAEARFEAALTMSPGNLKAAYLLGLARVARGRLDESVAPLRSVWTLADGSLRDRAGWLLANVHLRRGECDRAGEILKALRDAPGPIGPRAAAVLERLPRRFR